MATVRIGLRCLITVLVGMTGFAFGTGTWTVGVEGRLDNHADSIYVNRIKYEELEARESELQTLYYYNETRIAHLEERVDSLYTRTAVSLDIQLATYKALTGEDWE